LLSGVRPLTTGGRRAAQPARHRTAGKQPILVAITRDLLTYTGLGAEPVQGFLARVSDIAAGGSTLVDEVAV